MANTAASCGVDEVSSGQPLLRGVREGHGSVRLLFRVEKLVNVGLERVEGKCPGQ